MPEKNILWKVTDERYVGYIDIMGFKDLVMRSTHSEIYDIMKKIEHHKKSTAEIDWLGGPDNLGKKSAFIKTTTYSDSIIIYSKIRVLNLYTIFFVS